MTDVTFFWKGKYDLIAHKINIKKHVVGHWSGWIAFVDDKEVGMARGAQIHAKRLAIGVINSSGAPHD